MKTLTFLVALFAVTLTVAGSAMAQSISSDPYLNSAGQVQGQLQGGGGGGDDDDGTAASGSSLPFTGLDIALLAGGGFLLLGAGVAMRRLAPGARSA
jgi:hypothetical protein